jgi:CRISPR-associated protein Cas2
LRKVAKICLSYGQRVQKSVFECRVDLANFEELERKLLKVINLNEDNLRFYRLVEPLEKNVKEYGKFKAIDFENDTLIV